MTLILNDGKRWIRWKRNCHFVSRMLRYPSHNCIFCIHYCLKVYVEVGFIIIRVRTGVLWAPDRRKFSIKCSHAIRKIPLCFELICNHLKHIFRNKRCVSFHESIPNGITCLLHYFSYSIVCDSYWKRQRSKAYSRWKKPEKINEIIK